MNGWFSEFQFQFLSLSFFCVYIFPPLDCSFRTATVCFIIKLLSTWCHFSLRKLEMSHVEFYGYVFMGCLLDRGSGTQAWKPFYEPYFWGHWVRALLSLCYSWVGLLCSWSMAYFIPTSPFFHSARLVSNQSITFKGSANYSRIIHAKNS